MATSKKLSYGKKTQAQYFETDAGATADGIYVKSYGGGKQEMIITGELSAEMCGIDMSGVASANRSALLAACANPNVKVICFNNPKGGIYGFTGSVDCGGRTLRFNEGCSISGVATLSNFILDAPYETLCFSGNVTVAPKLTTRDMISPRNFAVVGDGTTDDTVAIQKVIDMVILNPNLPRQIYFTRGIHVISAPLLAFKWTGTEYTYVDFELIGYTSQKTGFALPEVTFLCTSAMANKFVIGVQRVRNVKIRNIWFKGCYTKSQEFTRTDICRKKFVDWTDGTARDTRWSPHCAINFDPFARTAQADGGYPGLSAYYRGTEYGGSSGCEVTGCRFTYFTVGVAVSINGASDNGGTPNCEIIHVNDSYFGHCKVAYAVGQDQTIQNNFYNNQIWEPVHTIIDCLNYGAGIGCPPHVIGCNVAGGDLAVHQLINSEAGRTPFFCKNFTGESMYKIGTTKPIGFINNASASFIDCKFDFLPPDYDCPSPEYFINGPATFFGCYLRIQGNDPKPWRMKFANPQSAVVFKGGTIMAPIVSIPREDLRKVTPSAFFENMFIYGYPQQLMYNKEIDFLNPNMYAGVLVGRTKIIFKENDLLRYTFQFNQSAPDRVVLLENAIVSVVDSGDATVTLSEASLKKVTLGDYLVTDDTAGYYLDQAPDYITQPYASGILLSQFKDLCPVLGYVYAIDYGTRVVTLRGCSGNIPAGDTLSIPVYCNYLRRMNNPLVCKSTGGSPVLTSVKYLDNPTIGQLPVQPGDRLESSNWPRGCYVVSTSYVDGTITLSENALYSVDHITVINGSPLIDADSELPPDQVRAFFPVSNFFEGTIWKSKLAPGSFANNPLNHYVITSTSFSGDNTTHPLTHEVSTRGLQVITTADLRFQYNPSPTTLFIVTDAAPVGFFKLDPTDTTSIDGADVIVGYYIAPNYWRFKRVNTNPALGAIPATPENFAFRVTASSGIINAGQTSLYLETFKNYKVDYNLNKIPQAELDGEFSWDKPGGIITFPAAVVGDLHEIKPRI